MFTRIINIVTHRFERASVFWSIIRCKSKQKAAGEQYIGHFPVNKTDASCIPWNDASDSWLGTTVGYYRYFQNN